MNTIFGITTDANAKFEDLFDIVYDDLTVQAVSKKTYEHKEDGLNFKYQYVISVEDTDNYACDDDRQMVYSLTLVPTFDSLTKKKQDKVMSCCDCGETIDVMDYGYGVTMGCDSKDVDQDFVYDYTEDKTLDAIASVVDVIDGLRGFYLDKAWNRIGTTGWDTLNDAINGVDMFDAAMQRMKKA